MPDYHPIILDNLDGIMVHEAALHTSGAAGPSGVDAYGWRHFCSAFGLVSGELCCSIAVLARRLCTSFVDPVIIPPLVACRLIALDKIQVSDQLEWVRWSVVSLLRLLCQL